MEYRVILCEVTAGRGQCAIRIGFGIYPGDRDVCHIDMVAFKVGSQASEAKPCSIHYTCARAGQRAGTETTCCEGGRASTGSVGADATDASVEH